MVDETEPYIQISWKEFTDQLRTIFNIGYGIEFDPVEGDVLRLEKAFRFYHNDVIMEINNIAEIKRTVDYDECFGTFEGGYDTWESEEFNGKDAFLTQRNYRTDTNLTSNKMTQVCKWIADGYAIEATRRRALDQTTKDYKYDEKTFIICLSSGGNASENGGGVANMINASSAYNVRISPARNMMRWGGKFLQLLPRNREKVIKFMSGKGNFLPVTKSSTDGMSRDKTIAENGDITNDNFNLGSLNPILKPEKLTFEYPLTLAQWKAIKANPLGIIKVNGESCYIREIDYATGF